MDRKKVDIIIPTYKPDDKFEKLIRGLKRQTYPIQNIFVINTKTGVFPWDTSGLDERVKVTEIEFDEFDHGGTRRMGAAMSNADIFICMTQDAVPADSRLIEELIAAFEDEKVGCAYARQLPAEDCRVIERYTRAFNYPAESCVKDASSISTMGIKAFFCSDVCAAYRKEYYEEVGGFPEHTIFNEDMITAGRMLKAGYKCAYAAKAKVIHSHNYSAVQQFKRNFDLAVSQEDNPDVFKGIKSESEGIRLVKKTGGYLLKNGKFWLIPRLIVQSGFKYMGYRLGHRYRSLSQNAVLKCSSNPKYWENVKEKSQK